MSTKSTPADDDKGLARLLLDLIWQIAVLVVPAVLVAWLPPLLAVAVFVMLGAAMWAFAGLGWMRVGRVAASLIVSVAFGLGFSVFRALPAGWDIAGGAAGIVGGLAFSAWWEKRLGLVRPVSATAGSRNRVAGNWSRPADWSGREIEFTPEGEPIRSFNHGEIAMGGPTYCDYLFADGTLLEGLGTYLRFSRDARYVASPVPSRSGWYLNVFDRQLRRLYRCNASDAFWDLPEFADGSAGVDVERQRASMAAAAAAAQASPNAPLEHAASGLARYLAEGEAVDLVPVADLWVEPGSWQTAVALTRFERPSPDGTHCLTGRLYLPESLRALADPTGPLRRPEYRIDLDGVPSGLVMAADVVLVWRGDGQALCGEARIEQGKEASSPYWIWDAGQGWRVLPQPWVGAGGEPSFYSHEPLALDAGAVRIAAYLDYPQPDHGAYGYALQSIHSDTEILVGHDAKGRMQIADVKLARTQLVLPLASTGARGSSAVESEALSDGVRARFDWQRDNAAEQGGYTCTIGDWILPGEWLLDHRVSDCGRYLVLLPFASAPAVPGHVSVADTQDRRLLHSPPLLAARLLDFRAGRVSLSVVKGRLRQDATSTPLHRIDTPAPVAAEAADFCAWRDDSRLYYEVCVLQVDEVGLRLLPTWREVSRPQLANADGNFVQPSPDGRDAAWLFGAETDYGDSSLLMRESRRGGYLLTASGCSVADLAPSMIWSKGGRYLALTRRQTDVYEDEDQRKGWRVLLLDVESHSMRIWPELVHSRPVFDSFAATALHVRVFASDWEDIGRPGSRHDAGTVTSIDLKAFLAEPVEALVACGDLWLPASEQSRAAQWLALDRSALSRWTDQQSTLLTN